MLRSLLKTLTPAAPAAAPAQAPVPVQAAQAPVQMPAPVLPPAAPNPIAALIDAVKQRAQATLAAGTQAQVLGEARERLARDERDLEALLILISLSAAASPEEVIGLHRRAVALRPLSVELLYSLVLALQAQRRYQEAIEVFRVLMAAHQPAQQPGHPQFQAHRFAFAMQLFVSGQYREGFLHFRARNLLGPATPHAWVGVLPEWRGESLAGARILVWTDWGGLGDELLFARYLKLLHERYQPAAIYLRCTSQDRRLLSLTEGVTEAFDQGGVFSVDCHVALLELPGIFGTDLDSIPAPVPYLHPDPQDVATWQERLARLLAGKPGLKVGLCWGSGLWNMGGEADRTRQIKSMPLQHLRELCAIEGVHYISLQKGIGRDELAAAGLPIHDFDAELNDMADTAALASTLDLVITVDTSVSHLAGGLGCATLVLVPYGSGSFWLSEIETSPWYPSVRLLRQDTAGDWAGVAARATALLRGFAAQGRVDVFAPG